MYSCSNPTITDYLKTHSIPNSESYVRYSIERYMREKITRRAGKQSTCRKASKIILWTDTRPNSTDYVTEYNLLGICETLWYCRV